MHLENMPIENHNNDYTNYDDTSGIIMKDLKIIDMDIKFSNV